MKDFHKYLKVKATAEEVYLALTKPFAIELWTGYPATMSTEPGSEFEMWEGDICGKNLEFEENTLIRQEWYMDQDEESIVTIRILAKSATRTDVSVTHTNIPDDMFEDISGWWVEEYMEKLRHFLEDDE